ncbi:unnamed protein product [Toxocara canis]|uniref:ADH_N domain-containing protein n=1 Tax=Toxocara canis TaxID=6265 RepID=A0A183VGR7_TOXCA|nr:unnamed protein product [Toxocara canis]
MNQETPRKSICKTGLFPLAYAVHADHRRAVLYGEAYIRYASIAISKCTNNNPQNVQLQGGIIPVGLHGDHCQAVPYHEASMRACYTIRVIRCMSRSFGCQPWWGTGWLATLCAALMLEPTRTRSFRLAPTPPVGDQVGFTGFSGFGI